MEGKDPLPMSKRMGAAVNKADINLVTNMISYQRGQPKNGLGQVVDCFGIKSDLILYVGLSMILVLQTIAVTYEA